MSYDAYGTALTDYFKNGQAKTLWLNNSYGDPEEMPLEVFFRERGDLSELELYAMSLVKGAVLDVGAGAGAHALCFQENGLEVGALEVSPKACEVMRKRNVKQVLESDLFSYRERSWDTLWLMMNGIGLAGKMTNLLPTLRHLKKLLAPEGRIILDSSDIRYLYPNDVPQDRYFGEIDYQYVYNGQAGAWFTWLYLDQRMLAYYCYQAGLICQIVYENKEDQYLAVLTHEKP